MSAEDQRAAANITVTVSGHLITAALAMLAVEVTVVSFVYGYGSQTSYWFLVLIIVAAASFIASIVIAGKGITILRNAVYSGTWNLDSRENYFNSSKNCFNLQAILCLVGLACFFSSAFLVGQPKDDELKGEINLLKQEIQKIKDEIEVIGK